MSRVISGEHTSNPHRATRSIDPKARIKRKKRKKDLEQLRRNVQAAKQSLRRESVQGHGANPNKASKNSLAKTLYNFAEIRHKNENETQGLKDKTHKESKGRTICSRLLPQPVIGIFKNGAKGQEVRRPVNPSFNGTNEARLRGDVFKLLNGGETSSPRKGLPCNIVEKSNCSNEDEEKKKGHDFDLTSHHSESNTIKGNFLSENVSGTKWKSNGERMEKGIQKYREVRSDVSENIQRDDVNKWRLFENDHDENNCETINLSQMEALRFFPRATKKDNNVAQKKLLKTIIDNNAQSIKRWGRSPAFHYEELCAKIRVENFLSCYIKPNVPDPVVQIRMTLANLYAEAHGQHMAIKSDDKTWPRRDARDSAIVSSKDDASSCEVKACSTNPISAKASASQSSFTTDRARPEVESDNIYPMQQWNLWNADKILPLHNRMINQADSQVKTSHDIKISADYRRILPTFATIHDEAEKIRKNLVDEEGTSRQQIDNQAKDLQSDYFNEPSPPPGWSASIDRQRNSDRKNVKHMPTILRRTSYRPGVSYNANLVEGVVNRCQEIKKTKNTNKSPSIKNAGTSQRDLLLENSKYLLTPSVVMRGTDNKANKIHKSKLNYMKAKYKAVSIPRLPSHKINTDSEDADRAAEAIGVIEKKTEDQNEHMPRNSEDSRIYTISIPSHVFRKPRNSNGEEDFARLNTKKREAYKKITHAERRGLNHLKQFSLNSPWGFNHPLPVSVVEGSPIKNNFEALSRNEYEDIPAARVPTHGNYQDFNQPYSVHHPLPMHRDDSFLTDISSGTMANKYFAKQRDSEVPRVPSMEGRRNFTIQCCPPSNFQHQLNAEVPFIPMIEQNQLRHDNNLVPSDIGINDAVLRNFKVLSFEEDPSNETIPFDDYHGCWIDNQQRPFLHLPQPSKYLAVPNDNKNGKNPRRVPIYLSVENPSIQPKMRSSNNVIFLDHQPPIYPMHKDTQRQKEQGVPIKLYAAKEMKNIKAPQELNLEMAGHRLSNVETRNNLRPISFNHGRDISVKDFSNFIDRVDSIPPTTSNVSINESQSFEDSQVREIMLADGRIGLFLPKPYHHNNQMKYHTTNSDNYADRATLANHSMYQSNNCQRHSSVIPNDKSLSASFI